ncbi:MAG: hypothetical protein R3B93_06115 [Bacteroidia bacterium]
MIHRLVHKLKSSSVSEKGFTEPHSGPRKGGDPPGMGFHSLINKNLEG